MPLCQADDLPEELLVDLPEDLRGDSRELIRALRIVEAADDRLQHIIIDNKRERQRIRRLVPPRLLLKVEQPRVIPVVGMTEEITEPLVDLVAEKQLLQRPIRLDPTILTDPQKDDPVNRPLDSEIQFIAGDRRVPESDVPCENQAPVFDIGEKCLVDTHGSFLIGLRISKSVKRTLQDTLQGEDLRDPSPLLRVLLVGDIAHPGRPRGIPLPDRFCAIIDRKLFKVREDTQFQPGVPGIPAQLERRLRIILDRYRRLLCLDDKLPDPADPERVIKEVRLPAYLDRVLMSNLLIRLRKPLPVINIPPQRPEERINELPAQLRLIVLPPQVCGAVISKAFDKRPDGIRTHNLVRHSSIGLPS